MYQIPVKNLILSLKLLYYQIFCIFLLYFALDCRFFLPLVCSSKPFKIKILLESNKVTCLALTEPNLTWQLFLADYIGWKKTEKCDAFLNFKSKGFWRKNFENLLRVRISYLNHSWNEATLLWQEDKMSQLLHEFTNRITI